MADGIAAPVRENPGRSAPATAAGLPATFPRTDDATPRLTAAAGVEMGKVSIVLSPGSSGRRCVLYSIGGNGGICIKRTPGLLPIPRVRGSVFGSGLAREVDAGWVRWGVGHGPGNWDVVGGRNRAGRGCIAPSR